MLLLNGTTDAQLQQSLNEIGKLQLDIICPILNKSNTKQVAVASLCCVLSNLSKIPQVLLSLLFLFDRRSKKLLLACKLTTSKQTHMTQAKYETLPIVFPRRATIVELRLT